jgi:hypothetical protein
MNNKEALICVPVSLLARLSDSLLRVRCIDGDLITGDIQQETGASIKAIQLHLDTHNAKQKQQDELAKYAEVTHA